ncbi:electron transfer flavoprotein subunit alpha/FixB family protein [Bacillus sp. P2(2020)]|uniref:Electron transfer flavoprotein subunit alpha/FixB family protein n=2 Tax=Calidifontibacillus erzurumensis TaxID=2741433 RepID=A0A8J8GDK7_9BACI|nr:electron transfer flavoprotein subunit alpha/FixB family protein [Calidifontibacillus erzurumensis]
MLYGGVVIGNYKLTNNSIVVTLNENSCREIYKNEENNLSTFSEETFETKPLKKKITQTREIEQTVDLKSSRKIVSIGRGINKQEDIGIVEQLANAIGAQLGCSRPIVEDFKWLKPERQVGLTGTIVAPDLYVAIGISGQIQHAVGIKDAKVIVAINNNKNAPIFEIADYGIVGDLYEVVPKLQQALQAVVNK